MEHETAKTFVKIQPQNFDLVVLMPYFVLGADPLVKNPGDLMVGSNGVLMNYLLGKRTAPMIKTSIHIDDVAKLHVQALDLIDSSGQISGFFWGPGGNELGGCLCHSGEAFSWKGWKDFVKGGDQVSFVNIPMDTEKVEEASMVQFQNFEKQMKNVAGNYLDPPGE